MSIFSAMKIVPILNMGVMKQIEFTSFNIQRKGTIRFDYFLWDEMFRGRMYKIPSSKMETTSFLCQHHQGYHLRWRQPDMKNENIGDDK